MSERPTDFLAEVRNCISKAMDDGLVVDARARGLSGISGQATVALLQRLGALAVARGDRCYLEIGVFQGLTLVSTAIAAPDLPCFGIDNFRILDPEGKNQQIVESRIATFEAMNARLINMDFEAALETLEQHTGGTPVGVYFVDGPHDYRSQLVCLLLAKRCLADDAVIVVDDANYPAVRQATRDFLVGHSDYKLLFEAYTSAHPANMDDTEKNDAEALWLNGINVIVRDSDDRLETIFPEVPAERTLYFNEWLVHRMRVAELAPEAVAFAQAVLENDDAKASAAKTRLVAAYRSGADTFASRFADRNTASAGLTAGRFARCRDDG